MRTVRVIRHGILPFYSEKLKQSLYAFSDEEIRPYFPLPKVLEGLFYVTQKLFGVRVQKAKADSLWHDDAVFRTFKRRRVRGSFYLDLFARAHKRGSA